MHLLQAQAGTVLDGEEPVDPGQRPADIAYLTTNDNELAALSAAQTRLEGAPSLVLGRLQWLSNPYSTDLYLDDTLTRCRLVVIRFNGGAAYWPYVVEQCAIRLAEAEIPFIALPGCDRFDEAMLRASTVAEAEWRELWAYLVEGGPANAEGFLGLCAHLLGCAARPPPPAPLPRAGLHAPGGLEALQASWVDGAPIAAIAFYRTQMQGAGPAVIDDLAAGLRRAGLNPLPIYVASLKDPASAAYVEQAFERCRPGIVLNATGFAVGGDAGTVLDRPGVPVLQLAMAGGSEADWRAGDRGLAARDIAMMVAMPEVDGRVLAGALAFKSELRRDPATQCPVTAHAAPPDRVAFISQLAANWARLRRLTPEARKVALVLANYPGGDGRLAHALGLDAPESCVETFRALRGAGYAVEGAPDTAADLMRALTEGPARPARLSLTAYRAFLATLPDELTARIDARWGPPEADPELRAGGFDLPIHRFGHLSVAIQPTRDRDADRAENYHAPDIPPTHAYLAFYAWLRRDFGAHALIHFGAHGNLEWLPGKALCLSQSCFPEAILGPTPHLCPFIVNNPGEGTQAKRRAHAVIVDHLTPPLTRAGTHGDLRELEALVDEYYEAAALDPRRVTALRREILSLSAASGVDRDAGVDDADCDDARLRKLDDFLCDLKEMQIRDGLHVFGRAPAAEQETALLAAMARIPRGRGRGAGASLIAALAADLGMADPRDAQAAAPWEGSRPAALAALSPDPWRSHGDALERLETLAARLIAGQAAPGDWPRTRAVLEWIDADLRPRLRACGDREMQALLDGLAGRFIAPGPSGAPTRGRADVLPTGRNFYSVDSRALPTPAAWTLGWRSAEALVARHAQAHGDWPRAVLLTAWGAANMRSGGDDIAQALALMGARPTWDDSSRRVTGFEILPLSVLERPRVDVTLRVSGFFRDAFPAQMDLIDSAARAVMALDEPETQNPAAARFRAEGGTREAGHRVFGSAPGAYGAGLDRLLRRDDWTDRAELGAAWAAASGHAYGGGAQGEAAGEALARRLGAAEAIIQNQDHREHDVLDAEDFSQFEGGAAAAAAAMRGGAPTIWHNDHADPERPVIRRLEEEIARVVRGRAANPRWIAGCLRHGYRGAAEMAATLDHLYAFAATTDCAPSRHFDLLHAAYLGDETVRSFLQTANPAALRAMAETFARAERRGFWRPRSNSAGALIEQLRRAS